MKLERILKALNENRIRATASAVAELAGVSSTDLEASLSDDSRRACWVVTQDAHLPVTPVSREQVSAVSDNPMVIQDATRLRVLVLATELTANIP